MFPQLRTHFCRFFPIPAYTSCVSGLFRRRGEVLPFLLPVVPESWVSLAHFFRAEFVLPPDECPFPSPICGSSNFFLHADRVSTEFEDVERLLFFEASYAASVDLFPALGWHSHGVTDPSNTRRTTSGLTGVAADIPLLAPPKLF